MGRLISMVTSLATASASVAAALVGSMVLSACGSCDSIVHQTAIPAIASSTFDAVAADQPGQRMFLADGSGHGVDVVDISGSAPRLLGKVPLAGAVNGLAYVPSTKRLYAAADGGDVGVIDAGASAVKDMKVVDSVLVDPTQADLVDYSPQTRFLYVGTGSSNKVVVVDTTSDQVIHTFDLKSSVEQPRYDPADGKIYVSVPGNDAVEQLDPSTGAITRKFVQSKCHPAGLAINPSRQIAMAACRSSTVVFNLNTGLDEVSRSVPGGDLVNYDAAVDRFTVGSAHGPRDSSVGVFYGNARFMGIVQASENAHGAVFNDSTGVVYAVSATGLLSFTPSACAPPPAWLGFASGLSVFVAPLAAFGLLLVWYARRRSRGVDPKAKRRRTYEELQEEDLAAERERIRDLEDAIYGPDGG